MNFLEAYQQLVLDEPESAVSQALKEAFWHYVKLLKAEREIFKIDSPLVFNKLTTHIKHYLK